MRYLPCAVLIFFTEVLIALYARGFLRGFCGDALVIVLLYCLLRSVVKGRAVPLAFGVFLFGCFIEVCQYFDYVKLLGLEHNRVLSIVLGRTFSPDDFGAYFVGFLIIVAAESAINRRPSDSPGGQ